MVELVPPGARDAGMPSRRVAASPHRPGSSAGRGAACMPVLAGVNGEAHLPLPAERASVVRIAIERTNWSTLFAINRESVPSARAVFGLARTTRYSWLQSGFRQRAAAAPGATARRGTGGRSMFEPPSDANVRAILSFLPVLESKGWRSAGSPAGQFPYARMAPEVDRPSALYDDAGSSLTRVTRTRQSGRSRTRRVSRPPTSRPSGNSSRCTSARTGAGRPLHGAAGDGRSRPCSKACGVAGWPRDPQLASGLGVRNLVPDRAFDRAERHRAPPDDAPQVSHRELGGTHTSQVGSPQGSSPSMHSRPWFVLHSVHGVHLSGMDGHGDRTPAGPVSVGWGFLVSASKWAARRVRASSSPPARARRRAAAPAHRLRSAPTSSS